MIPRKTVYLVHRWLGLLVSLQLLAWSAGGFTFSILHIDDVRGERAIAAPECDPLAPGAVAELPASIRALINDHAEHGATIGSVALVDRGLGPRWEVRTTEGVFLAGDAPANAMSHRITPDDAKRLARRDFEPEAGVADVRLIEGEPPIEYREKPLPAYQVTMDHPTGTRIYVDAQTGAITARRNDKWRVFDFFWMLHTMDYNGRDDFNHPLLTAFSILAMITALSGLSLWMWRAVSRFRRRHDRASRRAAGPRVIA